jgi:hypothetical protein
MRSLAALCLCARSFEHGVAVDGGAVDMNGSAIDAPIDMVIGTNCYGPTTGAFRICRQHGDLVQGGAGGGGHGAIRVLGAAATGGTFSPLPS